MLKIVGLMLTGIVVGYLLRNRDLAIVQKCITVAIWVLLFLLGVAVGMNDEIIRNMDVLGWQAFILSVGTVGGSVVLAWVVYKYFFGVSQD